MTESIIIFESEKVLVGTVDLPIDRAIIDFTDYDTVPSLTSPLSDDRLISLRQEDTEIQLMTSADSRVYENLFLRVTEWPNISPAIWASQFRGVPKISHPIGIVSNLDSFYRKGTLTYALQLALKNQDVFLVPIVHFSHHRETIIPMASRLASIRKEINVIPCLSILGSEEAGYNAIETFYKHVLMPISDDLIYWSLKTVIGSNIFDVIHKEKAKMPKIRAKPKAEVQVEVPPKPTSRGKVIADSLTVRYTPSVYTTNNVATSVLVRGDEVEFSEEFYDAALDLIMGKIMNPPFAGYWCVIRLRGHDYVRKEV